MNFAITYTATYRYAKPVSEEHDVLRITPVVSATQRVHAFDVKVDPAARPYRHRDYFGTEVIQFSIPEPHTHLEVVADARVATRPGPEAPHGSGEALAEPAYRQEGREFLLPWSSNEEAESLNGLIDAARRPDPLDSLVALTSLIPERFEYRPGATYVASTIDDLLRGGAGVCQDFVHLGLAILRRLGIAARYVSGYLFAPGENGGASAEVDTHAWLEALLPGPDGEMRWVGADPTNDKLAGPEHVKIGHGRNYSDVPPLKGVYNGQTTADHQVTVRMIDLDAERI